jgi:four helix bundle protein
MKDFRRLKVWEKVHHLTLDIYKDTTRFPREELYGLTSQMRRSSASMGMNIAEGCGKQGNNELHRFLHIASGSASELDYQLLLARDLNYLTCEDYRRIDQGLLEVRKMLTALIQKVGTDRFVANG